MSQFTASKEYFLGLTERMGSGETMCMSHYTIENILTTDIRELARRLFEEHMDLRDPCDVGDSIVGSDGVVRRHKRMREKTLICLFGQVTIKRLGYGARGYDSLFPKDALLNLPTESYSHGIRKLVAQEAAKNSFSEVVALVKQLTGAELPRAAVEMLTRKAAVDFDTFYAQKKVGTSQTQAQQHPLLILTTDGKGVVMRQEDLKEETRKKAEQTKHKLKKRQSKGEKANAKRIAIVASVYHIDRFVRSPEQIVQEMKSSDTPIKRPRPVEKRVWASIEQSSKNTTMHMFEEALRRDPTKKQQWVCLVDGDPKQLKRIKEIAKKHGVNIIIVLDIIHVIEYLWKASRVFYEESSSEAERWVSERLFSILRGQAGQVAAGMKRSATLRKITQEKRKPVDKCAGYLLKNKSYLQYDLYLKEGFPIATGVIEGACRHLIKDRMDVTGARWSLEGAEAIIKLRSLRSSGDFENYWEFHEDQEYIRNHLSCYADPAIIDKIRKPRMDKHDNVQA